MNYLWIMNELSMPRICFPFYCVDQRFPPFRLDSAPFYYAILCFPLDIPMLHGPQAMSRGPWTTGHVPCPMGHTPLPVQNQPKRIACSESAEAHSSHSIYIQIRNVPSFPVGNIFRRKVFPYSSDFRFSAAVIPISTKSLNGMK